MQDSLFRLRSYLPAVLVLLVAGALIAPRTCARGGHTSGLASGAAGPPSDAGSSTASLYRYPKGRWRLAQRHELDQAILWVSHIVIAHRNSRPEAEYHFRPLGWRPDPPNPERSEEAALEAAVQLAERLGKTPEDFAAVARRSSDDVVTRDAGGSLGGVRPMQLPPDYVDALAALRVGEVSRVIRTNLGFTILMRRPPPADIEVAGRRILFRHRTAIAAPYDEKIERTRAQALALAQQAVENLRSGATTFDALAVESDSASVVHGGDMGVWKLRDPGDFPRQIDALGRLLVSEISDPIESVFGFEVLQRIEVTPRIRYAMQSIQIDVDPRDEPGSGASLSPLPLAESIAARLAESPELFPSMLENYCCVTVQRWSAGRGLPGIDQVLEQLAIGAIAAKPVRSGMHYYIPKRLDPTSFPEDPPPRYELPAPNAAQLAPMVEYGEGSFIAQRTRELAKEVLASMELEPSQSAELSRLFEDLATAFEANPHPKDGLLRVEKLESTQASFFKVLGPTRHRQLNDVIDAWITRLIMSTPN
jgi:hypothetical protein